MKIALDMPSATDGAATLKLAPLDVPLSVECAQVAPEAIGVACRGWEGAVTSASEPLRLRIATSPALAGTGDAEIEVEGSRLTVRGPGVNAYADFGQGFAECVVSAEYLKAPATLRQKVLEPLVLMMLTHRDRTPVHAAAFIVDGLAILLAGRTGAGKSCLARAADTAGFQVLSEDTVYVQLAPRLMVWGWPTAAHLLAEDAPDVAGPTRLRGGKVKQVLPLRSASQQAIACNRAILCLLSKSGDGSPTLSPVTPAAIEQRLWPLDEGFDLMPGPIAKAIEKLSAGGVWDLGLSADPAQAVRFLQASLPRLRGISSP